MFTRVIYAATPRNCWTRYPPRYSNGWAEFWSEPMKLLVDKLNHAHWLRMVSKWNFFSICFKLRIVWCVQGRSQPHHAHSTAFLIFPRISVIFSYSSSNFPHFCPHFETSGLGKLPTQGGPGYATGWVTVGCWSPSISSDNVWLLARLLHSVGLASIVLVHFRKVSTRQKFFAAIITSWNYCQVVCIGFLRLFEVCVLQLVPMVLFGL